jgi:hypothetical protein
MADQPPSQAVAQLIVENWHWIIAALGAMFSAVSGILWRVCRSLVDWSRPKLENVYATHMELVKNLNMVIPGMAEQLKSIETRQTTSYQKLTEVHRLMTAEEEWDRESHKERERQK